MVVKTSPDLNTAIAGFRSVLATWWKTDRYRAAVAALLAREPVCCRCGRPATTALHVYPDDYRHGFDHYVGLVERGARRAGCQRCNREEQRNRRPCPECVKEYQENPETWISYIPFTEEECFRHKPAEERSRLIREGMARKAARSATGTFPCGSRLQGQGCSDPRHLGACDRSAHTADGCTYFSKRQT